MFFPFSVARLLALASFCLGVPLFAEAAPARELPAEVVVALKPDKDPDKMLAERESLAKALGSSLGRPVKVIVPLSTAVIIEGLSNGSIDLGYLSATDMVNARNAGAANLLLVGEIDGQRSYESVWLCLKDSPHKQIADLQGKPVAFASRTSTSGYLVPLLDLKKQNLIEKNPTEFFGEGNVWFGTGYMSSVERVLAGEAEAAAVSDYVYDKDKHLTPEQKSRLRILAKQGPVPTHVIAVASSLTPEASAQLRAALLDFSEKNPSLRDTIFTSRLVETDAKTHLQPVEDALAFAKASQSSQ
jgi:phosphonate transport system substrate-binding protein